MDPDDDAIAEIKTRGHITDAVFPDEWRTCDGPQTSLENLTRINENEEARSRELLVNETLEILQGQREGDLARLRQQGEGYMSSARTALKGGATRVRVRLKSPYRYRLFY